MAYQLDSEPTDPARDSISDKSRSAELVAAKRTANVLLAFAGEDTALGISEVARRLNLAKSVVHRIVSTLVQTGLLDQDGDRGRYRLGPRAIELGVAAIGGFDARVAALPVMTELVRMTGETATMSLRVGLERVYVSQVESTQEVHMSVEIGRRFPLYAGASGRAILAFLPHEEQARYLVRTPLVPLAQGTLVDRAALETALEATRGLGYAVSRAERDPWAASVAVPLFRAGTVIGSVSLCGPLDRFTDEAVSEFGRVLVTAARDRLAPVIGR